MAKRESALESMVVDPVFWQGRRVLLTGHTGFKGSWLALWLQQMGAKVHGFALAPEHPSGLFLAADVSATLASECIADLADFAALECYIQQVQPERVFHLAAQPLVRRSYLQPVETFSSNVMGLVNLMQVLRQVTCLQAILVVSSDKCYQNQSWPWGYRENDRLGGADPYSASKACQELVVESFRSSFYAAKQQVAVASARAGNVIGGGDWSEDRLIPDAIRAMQAQQTLTIRAPHSVRPWQHVLDCLHGYLLLMQQLVRAKDASYAQAWNFGPLSSDELTVEQLLGQLKGHFGDRLCWQIAPNTSEMKETELLLLDSSMARKHLSWRPAWSAEQAIRYTADWYLAQQAQQDMRQLSLQQLRDFMAA